MPSSPDDAPKLVGKTALVTGAARRLGRAVSASLAERGANVAIHYRASTDEAEALASSLGALGVKAGTFKADLEEPAQAEALFASAVREFGSVDLLVNNASIFPEDRITDTTLEAVERNLRINAFAPLTLSRALFARGGEGSIVNILDTRFNDYDAVHAAYHLSKRMLYTVTRMTALEFAPKVRVNGVAPGLILPPEGKDDRYLESLAHTNPLNRVGSEGEIVRAVLYLLTAEFVTGQVIFVDGGRHLKGCVYG